MKKVAELTGALLDYWVARAEGSFDAKIEDWGSGCIWCVSSHGAFERVPFRPSTNWAQGGPIIERERIRFDPTTPARIGWLAQTMSPWACQAGDTHLEAAMRAYVASKFGAEVEEFTE